MATWHPFCYHYFHISGDYGVVNFGYTCKGCKMNPIIGHCFKFSKYRGYWFCEMCKNKNIPDKLNLKPTTDGKHYNFIW